MKKRMLKITALAVAVILIVGVCLFANAMIGNPISKALAKNTAEKHLAEVYGDRDFELERVSYSFKDGYYHAYVVSPSSMDSSFMLLINGLGKLMHDDYEYSVTNGWNTAHRLEMEYRKTVDLLFESSSFPYQVHIGYGEFVFVAEEEREQRDVPEYALITNELTLDGFYNVNQLGAKAGRVCVYVTDERVTYERLGEVLLGIRDCFDRAGIGFYTIDCVLEAPRSANGEFQYEQVEVRDFLYSDIYEEGLSERVEASHDAAEKEDDVWNAESFDEVQ